MTYTRTLKRPNTMQKIQDGLLIVLMWLTGFAMISAFLAFSGLIGRYVTTMFCFGYGC